eukprot:COSAG02_NODE_67471_length_253_cov_0.532468_1_plen_30_part_10
MVGRLLKSRQLGYSSLVTVTALSVSTVNEI